MFGLITGTVFRDIEVKESKAGKLYARATIKDGFAEETIFVTVYAFDGTNAFEVLRNATKDDALSAQGRVKFRTYEKDGVTKVGVDLMADNILPVKGIKKPRDPAPVEDDKPRMTTAQRAEFIEDTIPF